MSVITNAARSGGGGATTTRRERDPFVSQFVTPSFAADLQTIAAALTIIIGLRRLFNGRR